MSAAPVIRVRDLDFSYGRQPALQDVHFDINALDFVSVIGPNGGGKSTLLKLLLGLLSPRRGTIEVRGGPPAKSRLKLGYMPQRVDLDPRFPVTVAEATIMGRLGLRPTLGALPPPRPRGRPGRPGIDRGRRPARPPSAELSGGQRQKVLIARALAGEPEILLLDEPTASLDPAVQDDLYALLNRLNATRTILMVSHDASMVALRQPRPVRQPHLRRALRDRDPARAVPALRRPRGPAPGPPRPRPHRPPPGRRRLP